MSKITVRADDDLVASLEALDASKSQVVREALRAYLDGDEPADALTAGEVIEDADGGVPGGDEETLDDLVSERVDELVTERLDEAFEDGLAGSRGRAQDVNVTVNVEGAASDEETSSSKEVSAPAARDDAGEPGAVDAEQVDRMGAEEETSCGQCGADVAADHVYCPNCGEKATRRSFCECGDELRSDWAFCPTCGRRTPAADVLDSG